MRRIGIAWAFALGSTGWAAEARAEPVEVAHEVRVDFAARAATMTVRRSVQSSSSATFEAHLTVETDRPVVATGLRTLGDDGRWYAGKLQGVEAAVATYWMLTGSEKVIPDHREARSFDVMGRPRDPALMMWGPTGFDVYAFPVAEGQPRTVEYTLVATYTYVDGGHEIHVPAPREPSPAPRVTIGAVPAGHRVMLGERALRSGDVVDQVPGTDPDSDVALRLVPTTTRPLTVRLAATPAGTRSLVRAEVEVGTELGPDPTNTHAVVVIDRSRSLTPDHQDAARRAALAYLEQLQGVAGSRVEVVTFDRTATARFGRFVGPAEAAATLQEPMTLANGSELADALELARARLATAPARAPRRVVVLSDTTVDPAREPAVVAALTGLRDLEAVVHVAEVMAERSYSVVRVRTGDRLEGLVQATGGAMWSARYDVEYGNDLEVFAEWVRPQTLYDVEVKIDGVGVDWWWALSAGEGSRDVAVREAAPRQLTARGRLWGTQLAVTGHREAREDRAWSTMAAAYLDDLSTAEIKDVALRAGAVSPATALLALEPHVQPGTARSVSVHRERRWGGCGMRVGNPHRYVWISLPFDEERVLREAIAAARHACVADARAVEVEITTGYAEVLAIPRVEVAGDAGAAACVEDKLWGLEFPFGEFHVVRRTLTLPGAG